MIHDFHLRVPGKTKTYRVHVKLTYNTEQVMRFTVRVLDPKFQDNEYFLEKLLAKERKRQPWKCKATPLPVDDHFFPRLLHEIDDYFAAMDRPSKYVHLKNQTDGTSYVPE